jgi:hypothetical protein
MNNKEEADHEQTGSLKTAINEPVYTCLASTPSFLDAEYPTA